MRFAHKHRSPEFWGTPWPPTTPVEVIPDHPLGLAGGLVSCYLARNWPRLIDICGVQPDLTMSGTIQLVPYTTGPSLFVTTVAAGMQATAGTTFTTRAASAASLFWYGERTAGGVNPGGVLGITAHSSLSSPYSAAYLIYSSANDIQAQIGNSNNAYAFVVSSGNAFSAPKVAASAALTWGQNTNINLYIDGAVAGTPAAGGGFPLIQDANAVIFMSGCSVLNQYPGCVSIMGLFYARELTANQVAWLHREPFAMLRPVVQRSYYIVPAAAPSVQQSRAIIMA